MKSFTIVFATQKGQAKAIAELIHDSASKHGFQADFFDISKHEKKFHLNNLSNPLVFVCSTTGDGEVPEMATKTFKKLKLEQNTNALSNLNYALLGLGDTNYTQFCNGPKLFHQQFQRLGARCFYGPFWADDGTGLELTVDPFIEGLWDALEKQFEKSIEAELAKLTIKQEFTVPQLTHQTLFITYSNETFIEENKNIEEVLQCQYPLLLKAQLNHKTTLTSENAVKQCYHFTFSQIDFTEENKFDYEPGHSIDIIVQNDDNEIEELFKLLEISPEVRNKRITLKSEAEKKSTSNLVNLTNNARITLWILFKYFIDIRFGSLKKSVLRTLAEYCSNEKDKQSFLELSSKEGSKLYEEIIRENQLNLVGLFKKYSSCRPKLDHLIQLLSPLALRSYSISSYQSKDRNLNIEFIFKLVELPNGCKGVATNYLSNLNDGDTFYFLKRKLQNFTLPDDFLHKPLIMIGPGSGVAPFIGFLKLKSQTLNENNEKILYPWWLFFGCRDSQADFLFKQELLVMARDKSLLSEFFVAFSQYVSNDDRTNYHLEGSKYVQDSIRLKKTEIVDLIVNKQAYIYVCGDAKNMSKDVFNCLSELIEEEKIESIVDAKKYLIELMSTKRYRQDIWC